MDETPKLKKKRRGNPDRYREYMREYMREYRARAKSKFDPARVNLGSALDRGYEK